MHKPAALTRRLPFRVHFEDGQIVTIAAESAEAARKEAKTRHPGALIRKVKIDRETRHA